MQGSHPYQSLSYTSGDTAADSPAHVSRAGLPAKDSPRKESLLSNLTGSFRSLHNLLEGTPQRNEVPAIAAAKSSSLTRTGTCAWAVVTFYSVRKIMPNGGYRHEHEFYHNSNSLCAILLQCWPLPFSNVNFNKTKIELQVPSAHAHCGEIFGVIVPFSFV